MAKYRKSPHLIPATGELAFIPAGTVHTFAQPGPAAARTLIVMTPEIGALISALHGGDTCAAV